MGGGVCEGFQIRSSGVRVRGQEGSSMKIDKFHVLTRDSNRILGVFMKSGASFVGFVAHSPDSDAALIGEVNDLGQHVADVWVNVEDVEALRFTAEDRP